MRPTRERNPRPSDARATATLNADCLPEQFRLHGLIWEIDDPFILGTLWW